MQKRQTSFLPKKLLQKAFIIKDRKEWASFDWVPNAGHVGYFSLLQEEDAGVKIQLSTSLSTLLDSIMNKFVLIGMIMLR